MGEYQQQKHTQHASSTKTTSMVGLENGHIRKNLPKMVNPRDTGGECRRGRRFPPVCADLNYVQVIWRKDFLKIIWTQFRIFMIIIMIIIAFKDATRDFYNLLTAPQTVSKMSAQVAWAQLCANHVHQALIMYNMSCYMPCGTKGQLSY